MTSDSRKVLVLGDDTRSFLAVVRSLGRAGIRVHVAWHDPTGPAARSRYIAAAHVLPPPDAPDEAWKPALVELMRRERFDLVIPCHDTVLIPLRLHRRAIERLGRLAIAGDDAMDVLCDKFRTTELARGVGVNVPRELILTTPADAARIPGEFRLPVVLKPRASHAYHDLRRRNEVRKAFTWDEFHSSAADMLKRGPIAVQENVIGHGVGVELLLRDGAPVLAFQHERLHAPVRGGGSTYRRSVPVSEHLLDASLRLLRPLKYTGVAMVEFRVERGTGKPFLLEVNARFWGSLPLALAAGADFPLALFKLLCDCDRNGPPPPPSPPVRTGVRCRDLTGDAWWHVDNLRTDRSDPTLDTSPVVRDALETCAGLLRGRERVDTWALDDPAPAVAEVRQLCGAIAEGVRRKVRHILWGRSSVRRRMRQRARAALRGAREILFVCQGNVCRSPFAERLLRRMAARCGRIESAGYFPRAGRMAPATAVSSAAGLGVDLTPHRSRVVTAEMVRRADVVFVFDQLGYERMRGDFPFRRPRVFPLGVMSDDARPVCIDDPWDGDRSVFDATYRHIRAALLAVGREAGSQT